MNPHSRHAHQQLMHASRSAQEHRRRVFGRSAALPGSMLRAQRYAVYAVFGVLWASGCAWLVLDQFFRRAGEFGSERHPWQGPMLLVHGVVGLGSLYLLGWVSARHVLRWWPSRLRRISGTTLAAFFVLLTMSGFALFFLSDDRWQHASRVTHDILGVAVTVFAIQHWFFMRRRAGRDA